ncbi:hypothetical protein NET02_14840 [Thermomicrobiaceae bacterium CFH 74404]|uniref:Lipoprotein n=1 Tax=Thermalbibacter longus TaxID=2951981 RepID=A0AA41WI13_9BACT|nr:hypothetical protein [Thermalbibacter longus]MCM8750425.1 hypothetical protein [Thermalbibacter longus]
MRLLLLLSAILLAACQARQPANPAATATRSAELTAVAAVQATATAARPASAPAVAPPPLPTPTPAEIPGTPGATAAPPASLLDRLPGLADLPSGFALDYEDPDVTAPEIAANYPDPDAHLDRLQQWGFAGSAYREFSIPSPGVNDAMQRMIIFRAQVSRYGSPESTSEALRFQLETTRSRQGWNLTEVSTQPLGDETVALQGTAESDGTTFIVAVLLVRRGDLLYRYEGASLGYNPYPDVVSIAERTLSRG